MEEESPPKSMFEPELFEIPIDQYLQDMETDSAKGKENEILDLLNNYNKLLSEEEFEEIENELHSAIKKGDVDLIKIFLSKTIENDSNTLQFKIDSTNRTASLFKVSDDIEEIVVPRTVQHESTEYLITSIAGTSKNLKKLKFVEDSAVKTIYEDSLDFEIEEIYFPPSLIELKDGWCFNKCKLTKITISPMNGQFKMVENSYILGKSDSNKDEFDVLLFVFVYIKEFSIPSNIKVISSSAFASCYYLEKVEFPADSNLQTIGEYAFSGVKIKEIFIPASVSKICKGTFSICSNLTKVEIPTNSNLQAIGSYAFSYAGIKCIFIPSKVSIICDHAFHECLNLQIIEFSEDLELESFPLSAFDDDSEIIIMIPSSLKELIQINEQI